jgi:excinuclease ABC subunit C
VRGTRHRWLQLAATNASQGLALRMTASASAASQLAALADALGLEDVPARIDCFDVSHTGGGETVASCVVFGPEGAVRSDYRRYNIRDVQAGDDYGAMAQVLQRRYTRVSKGEGVRPDLILVDGGAGQVARAWDVLQDLQLSTIPLVGAAKGRDRRPGEERLFRPGQAEPLTLAPDSVALHIVQQIRDEAHRFAITGHRQRRARAAQGSGLDGIPGLGPLRRRALLRQFGGLQGVRAAGVADLARVQGVSRALAERVYAHLHGGSG